MSWRKNTRAEAGESRHFHSGWDGNSHIPDADQADDSAGLWLLAVPILIAIATVILILRG